ncbi:DsrE family protein [Streptomyces sp. NPDC001663]|uniref:DsrE family protein n=1 Tax=Streptomyces sp. NPDC001663 TaxID=3364597 RepID=UPI0036A0CFBB
MPDEPGFVLIESSGPASGPAVPRFLGDATTLARSGHPVRLVLVQEGVTAALPAAQPQLAELLSYGAELWVDRYALTQRGLDADQLPARARLVGMDEVAGELLAPGTKVVWH